MPERLHTTVRSRLHLEQRVPETHSATQLEHRWHPCPSAEPVDVTASSVAHVMEHVDVLLGVAPKRDDYEYRVTLIHTETTDPVRATRRKPGQGR